MKNGTKLKQADVRAWWTRNRLSCIILAAAVVLFAAVRMLVVSHEHRHS